MGESGFIEHLRELFAPHAAFEPRRMFGGWGIYLDGLMCGLVAEGQLYLKTDAESRLAFEAAGSQPFVYAGKGRPITMSYWSAPEEALESAEQMRPWASKAQSAARAANTVRGKPVRKPAAREGSGSTPRKPVRKR
jgi:DNA transformation protein and related proteins